MVAHTFNPNNQKAEVERNGPLYELRTSLVYVDSARSARAKSEKLSMLASFYVSMIQGGRSFGKKEYLLRKWLHRIVL